jgi:hypothetical protein
VRSAQRRGVPQPRRPKRPHPEWEVLISLDQLGHARQILAKNRDQREPVVGRELPQEAGLDLAAASALQKLTDLGQHGGGHEQRLVDCLDPLDAALVICVTGVDQCDERPCIDDDHRSGGFRLAELRAQHVLRPTAKIGFAGVGDPDKRGATCPPRSPRDETQRLKRVAGPVLRNLLDELVQLLSFSRNQSIADGRNYEGPVT